MNSGDADGSPSGAVLYKVATVAVYLLGTAVLHARRDVPVGMEAVKTLAAMYIETLGRRTNLPSSLLHEQLTPLSGFFARQTLSTSAMIQKIGTF
jgi:hypothetical protein